MPALDRGKPMVTMTLPLPRDARCIRLFFSNLASSSITLYVRYRRTVGGRTSTEELFFETVKFIEFKLKSQTNSLYLWNHFTRKFPQDGRNTCTHESIVSGVYERRLRLTSKGGGGGGSPEAERRRAFAFYSLFFRAVWFYSRRIANDANDGREAAKETRPKRRATNRQRSITSRQTRASVPHAVSKLQYKTGGASINAGRTTDETATIEIRGTKCRVQSRSKVTVVARTRINNIIRRHGKTHNIIRSNLSVRTRGVEVKCVVTCRLSVFRARDEIGFERIDGDETRRTRGKQPPSI